MIALWNRRELDITWDMSRQAEIRSILAANGIDYTVKAENPQTTNFFGVTQRGRTGSLGLKTEYSYQYKIYVHKKDFEKAAYLIKDVARRK